MYSILLGGIIYIIYIYSNRLTFVVGGDSHSQPELRHFRRYQGQSGRIRPHENLVIHPENTIVCFMRIRNGYISGITKSNLVELGRIKTGLRNNVHMCS